MGKKTEFLVGYTGFVGSNIAMGHDFCGLFNSKNISGAFDKKPDLLIYSGVRAEKFLANKDPEADMANIKIAMGNIQKIQAKKVVLISTIDVYKNPNGADEDTPIDTEGLHAYGLNRYRLEKWVEENCSGSLIVRLPGLYGENIKKNFIYDMINLIPSMLTESKFNELCNIDGFIKEYYGKQDNGFYKCLAVDEAAKDKLKGYFKEVGFSALNFTDSRGKYQFYNLKYLWQHIRSALDAGISKLNLAVEGITAGELYKYVTGNDFINELSKPVPNYDFRTIYGSEFNGKDGYIFDKGFILDDIKKFVGVSE